MESGLHKHAKDMELSTWAVSVEYVGSILS